MAVIKSSTFISRRNTVAGTTKSATTPEKTSINHSSTGTKETGTRGEKDTKRRKSRRTKMNTEKNIEGGMGTTRVEGVRMVATRIRRNFHH